MINKFSLTIIVLLISSSFSTFLLRPINFPSNSNLPYLGDFSNNCCQCQCYLCDDEDEAQEIQLNPFIGKPIFQNDCKISQLNGKKVNLKANINVNSIIVHSITQMKFNYGISGNRISIDSDSSMKKAKLNPSQCQLEKAFIRATTFEINKNQFILKDSNGKIIIVFVKLTDSDLISNSNSNQVNIQTKPLQIRQIPAGLKYVNTSRGRVGIIKICDPVPKGWKVLQLNVGKQISSQLKPLLQHWSIVAFDRGKLAGAGYGFQIQDTYGPEAGQKFITEIC